MPLIRWPLLPVDARLALSRDVLFKALMTVDDQSRTLGMDLLLECDSDLRGRFSGRPRLKRRTRP